MQPYLFPYLGYFQLLGAADMFVFYDDVNFIKGGWINRNRILINAKPVYFTVPLAAASSFVAINKTRVHRERYPRWRLKFLQTLKQHYGRALYFAPVYKLVQETLTLDPGDIAALAIRSIEHCAAYLEIGTAFKISSRDFPPTGGRGLERILEVCCKQRVDVYINAPGGKELYHRDIFERERIQLEFLQPRLNPYPQNTAGFVPGLSILDVLMHNSPHQAQAMLEQYTLE